MTLRCGHDKDGFVCDTTERLRALHADAIEQWSAEVGELRARLERAEFVIKDTRASVIHLNRQVSTFGIAATILERIDAFLADRETAYE